MTQRIAAFAQTILLNASLTRSTILAVATQTIVPPVADTVYETPPLRPAFIRESDDTKIREE